MSIPATIDQPAVAMTPAGDVLVAWTATGQANQHAVFHRVRKGFTGFGDFSPPALGDHPVAATESGGRIWIAFHDAANGEIVLTRSSHTDPEAFTGVDHFAVPSAPVDLDLAVAPDDAVVTYVIGGQVKLRRWSAGITKDETMYDGAMNPAQDAAVTLDGTGNVMTAFTITPNIEARCPLKARRIPAGQAPAATQDLGDTGLEAAGCQSTNNVELTLGPSGRVMASWYQNVPTTIHAVVAAPGANFSPALPIADDTGPTPLTGNPESHTYGLLGASDAMLHTYIVRPGTFVHQAQRFRAGGAASALVSTFEISNRPAPLARNASEQAAGAWLGFTPGCQLTGAVGTVGSGLGGAQAIGPCGVNDATTSDPAVAIDPAGDAAAAWTADGVVELAVYDATPPEVAGVDAAATATVGQPASFSASARDALSATHVDWEFDDGTTATGDTVGHRFVAAGSHRVVVHVRDQAGNAVDVERTVVVSDPPGGAESGGRGGSGPGGSGGGGGGGGGTGTGTTDGGHADTGTGLTGDGGGTGPAMALRGSRLRAARNGVVALKVGCPASTAGGCTGTVALQLGATRAAASRSLASRAFNAAPGANGDRPAKALAGRTQAACPQAQARRRGLGYRPRRRRPRGDEHARLHAARAPPLIAAGRGLRASPPTTPPRCPSSAIPFVVRAKRKPLPLGGRMKYVALIYANGSGTEGLSEDEQKAVFGEYMALSDEPKTIGGNQLAGADTATTVRVQSGETLTTDGPFVETKEELGGYYLIEADDLDEAVAFAARIPAARFGGAVEVRPVVEM